MMFSVVEFLGVGIALILAITLHEAAHGMIASLLGDDTAKRMGRVTLNPIAHIDPFGTIILPGMLLFAGVPFLFGYAKPVPVNFSRLYLGRLGVICVAGGGPLMNFSLALGCAWLLHLNPSASTLGNDILMHSIRINIMLGVFNLLPLLPLDGGRVFHALLPKSLQSLMEKLEPYTFLILLTAMLIPLVTAQFLGHPIEILKEILLPPYKFFLKKILYFGGHGSF